MAFILFLFIVVESTVAIYQTRVLFLYAVTDIWLL